MHFAYAVYLLVSYGYHNIPRFFYLTACLRNGYS